MNKVLCLFVILLCIYCRPCVAKEINSDDLLSVVKLTQTSATQDKVTAMLGQPMRVEDGRKRIYWYYAHGKSSLVISWNKKSSLFEKFAFTSEPVKKTTFDKNLSNKLRSGATNLSQALTLLGTPRDMTIKNATQEMHYVCQTKLLRLFFRDRVLVDYCLY